MTTTVLQTKTEEAVYEFIRERLSFKNVSGQLRHVDKEVFKNEHRRFEMSGYESETGEVTVFNTAILNEFADLGIYDYTHYLFLDFYKGTPTLYLKYWYDHENKEQENMEIDLSGCGTIEIIYKIFELTIFSGRNTRRRI